MATELLWSVSSRSESLSLNQHNVLRFGLFFGSYVSALKGVQCILRHLRGKEDAWNALIAGKYSEYST